MKNQIFSCAFLVKRHFSAALIVCLLVGCQKDDGFEEQLNEMLESLPRIAAAFPQEHPATVLSTEEEKDEEYVYTIRYYSAAAGFDEQIVLNPQTDVIFPGALIKGESILDGSYIPIAAKRKPITISTSLTGNAKVSLQIADPRLSTVRTAINSLMNQEYDVPPANMGFTIEQAYSAEQLRLSLRASYSGIVDVSGGFDYSNKKIKTRLVAKFIQNYYTLDMDLPSSPADLFEDNMDARLFGSYMPMYISSVTYGRMALFTIESELEESQVRALLQGSYGSLDASASTDFEQLNASSTMKVYILGGSGADAGVSIDGFESFKNYIKAGGNFSRESPGAPISYKLRYISDNSIGKIVFAASYPIRTAVPRTDNIRYDVEVYFYSLKANVDDWGSDCELRGTIQSFLKRSPEATMHNHFAPIDLPENGERELASDMLTIRSLNDLLPDDTILVKVDIWEESEYRFPISTFAFPIKNMLDVVGTGTYYDTGDNMKLWGGSWEYIIVRFKFKPVMRRIPDPV